MADRLKGVIAPPKGHGAAHGLQIVAAATAGAGIDEHVRMPSPQFVPVGQVATHVLVLGDALTVFGIGRVPESQRVHVEVLAIEVDALLG